MALIGRLVDKLLKQGSITLKLPGKPPQTFGPGGGKSLTVRFTDNKVAFDILKNPRLGVGEAYMDGRLVVEDGTILDLLELVTGSNRWEDAGQKRKLFAKKRFGAVKAFFRRNDPRRARRNVAHHYDLSDELYEAFLDPDRQYSCAYYTDPRNSLEQAQADKKAHIAAKLHLQPGQRVLDIGSGWGGMALYLHQVADVDVLGVTLSQEQLKVARRRAEEAGVADRVKFELVDYRDVTGKFDRIVSIGMFEHLGPPFFQTFFHKCRELLADDGVALVHTMGRMGKPGTTDRFMLKYIFPGGYLPALSEIVSASERERLIMADCEALRLHYVYTLLAWYERLKARREEVVALLDERFWRLWTFYIAASSTMFSDGGMTVYQLQYLKRRDSTPIARDYMLDEEKRLRAKG